MSLLINVHASIIDAHRAVLFPIDPIYDIKQVRFSIFFSFFFFCSFNSAVFDAIVSRSVAPRFCAL